MGTQRDRRSAFRFAVGAVALLVLGSVAAPVVARADALVPISGSGSTWAQNAVDFWRRDLAQSRGQTVNYSGTGSSAGRTDFINQSVDFAISELPFQPSPEDGSLPESPTTGFAYVPAVAGATAFMYNLRIAGQQVTDLQLSGDVVTKIFTGAITNWNDPEIAADNPSLAMPDKTITPIVRSDGTGSSLQFTQWMSTQYAALWNSFCESLGRATPCGGTSQYPIFHGARAQNGSLGVAGYVSQDYGQGAITYVENEYALRSGFPTVRLLNSAGSYVSPSADAVSLALLQARVVHDPESFDNLTADLTGVYNSSDPRAYPLSSYTYLIVPTEPTKTFSASKGPALGSFARFALCEGQQRAESLGNAPLPINLVREGMAQLTRIPGAGSVSTSLSDCDNPAFALGEPEPALDGGVSLQATTIPAVDGALSLETVPGDAADFEAPTVVNGLSVTHGVLAHVTIVDRRVVSEPGWDITAQLTDFSKKDEPAVTIDKRQVGIRPSIIASDASGAQAAPGQTAGEASYPAAFASAESGSSTGSTTLGGEIDLISPPDKPAGTYTATLTLTVTSR